MIIKYFKTDFVFMSLFEGFYCFFLMSFFLACYFSLFVVVFSIFEFLKPGLTVNERNVSVFFIKGQFLIQFFSFLFLYKMFLPHLVKFLLAFEQNKNENFFNFYFQPRLLDYILVFWSVFYLIIFLFQISFFLFVLIQFRLVDIRFFIKNRREFIIFFLIIGCVFSPPDIYSQILLAFPCFLFYEIIIFFLIFINNV